MCSSGNSPAQATAKSVIASANRLIDVRHSWCSSSRIAEISVPAWPMPIHQTKLTIAKPHVDRDVDAPDADARDEQVGDRDEQEHRPARTPTPKPSHQRQSYGRVRTMRADLVGDRAEACAPARCTGRRRRRRPVARIVGSAWHVATSLRLELGVRVAQPRQVRRPRPGVQLGQQAVVARRRPCSCATWLLAVVEVAEDDRPRSGRPPGRRSRPRRRGSAGPRSRRRSRRRVIRCTQYVHFSITPRLRTVTSGLCSSFRLGVVEVGVLEEVEPPDLVRAVVRAVPRADAAVVDHVVEPLGAVRRSPRPGRRARTGRSRSACTARGWK